MGVFANGAGVQHFLAQSPAPPTTTIALPLPRGPTSTFSAPATSQRSHRKWTRDADETDTFTDVKENFVEWVGIRVGFG